MEIIHFEDLQAFQEYVLGFLGNHEAENNLLLGVLANLIGSDPRGDPPYLAVFQDAGSIQVVSLCTPPWPALISYQDPPPSKEIIKSILEDMQETLQDKFIGMTGNKVFVSRLVSQWEESTGQTATLEMSMRIYKLESVLSVSGVPGLMRPAKEDEKELLKKWLVGFHIDALKEEPDMERIQKLVKAYLAADPRLRGVMVWDVDDQPVSMVAYSGPTPNGIRIGQVYTPPEQRKQGYASALTAGASQYLLDHGHSIHFFVY